MLRLALATKHGVTVFRGEWRGWSFHRRVLEGEDILTARFFPGDPESLLAGSYGNGLFRVREDARVVEKSAFAEPFVRTICFSADDPATVYAGSEPAELFRSQDGGETWATLHVRGLPQAESWSLPYSPRAGALRSLVLPAADPFLIYAGVEQGGFLRSRDHGATWELEDQAVDKDIHSLSLCPENVRRLFAATGEGLFRTQDGGDNWERLSDEYTRGVAISPDDPQTVFSGPAADVGEGGWVAVSRDGGNSWSRCMEGLPDPMEDMVQLFFFSSLFRGRVLALTSSGGLFSSDLDRVRWEPIFQDVKGIQSLAICEE